MQTLLTLKIRLSFCYWVVSSLNTWVMVNVICELDKICTHLGKGSPWGIVWIREACGCASKDVISWAHWNGNFYLTVSGTIKEKERQAFVILWPLTPLRSCHCDSLAVISWNLELHTLPALGFAFFFLSQQWERKEIWAASNLWLEICQRFSWLLHWVRVFPCLVRACLCGGILSLVCLLGLPEPPDSNAGLIFFIQCTGV